jgi:uncharacterized protein (UPF0332 family)
MPITPNDILDFAERCSKNNQEVDFRNAIARAYYAAYHKVLSNLKNAPSSKEASAHKALIDYLSDDAFKHEVSLEQNASKSLGYILQGLKMRRGDSDYSLDKSFTQNDADVAIKDAKKFFTRCDEIFK